MSVEDREKPPKRRSCECEFADWPVPPIHNGGYKNLPAPFARYLPQWLLLKFLFKNVRLHFMPFFYGGHRPPLQFFIDGTQPLAQFV